MFKFFAAVLLVSGVVMTWAPIVSNVNQYAMVAGVLFVLAGLVASGYAHRVEDDALDHRLLALISRIERAEKASNELSEYKEHVSRLSQAVAEVRSQVMPFPGV